MDEYKGYRLLKPITVKELILAGARDKDVDTMIEFYGYKTNNLISLKSAIDTASSCSDKLSWLVDKGFVEKVEERLKPCPFCGGSFTKHMTNDELINESHGVLRHTIVCNVHKGGCGTTCGFHGTKSRATEVWNTRK